MNTKARVNGIQFFSITICFMLGTTLRTSHINTILHNDAWMAAFTGALAYLPELFVLLALAGRYPGKNLFEINEAVFGNAAGRALSCVYLYFFITTLAVGVFDMGYFVVGFLMPEMPLPVVFSAFILACGYAARKGFMPLARVSTLLALGAFLTIMTSLLLSIPNMRMRYLLPMLTFPPMRYVQGTHVSATICFGETIVFLALPPMLGREGGIKKPLLITAAVTTLVVFLLQIRSTLTLGPILPYVANPSYETIRLIDIDTVFTRLESIYALILVSLTFFRACTLLHASATGIAHVGRVEESHGPGSHGPIMLLTCGLCVVYALRAFHSYADSQAWAVSTSPFLLTAVEFVLPMLTLLTSWIRGAAGAGHGKLLRGGARE